MGFTKEDETGGWTEYIVVMDSQSETRSKKTETPWKTVKVFSKQF